MRLIKTLLWLVSKWRCLKVLSAGSSGAARTYKYLLKPTLRTTTSCYEQQRRLPKQHYRVQQSTLRTTTSSNVHYINAPPWRTKPKQHLRISTQLYGVRTCTSLALGLQCSVRTATQCDETEYKICSTCSSLRTQYRIQNTICSSNIVQWKRIQDMLHNRPLA